MNKKLLVVLSAGLLLTVIGINYYTSSGDKTTNQSTTPQNIADTSDSSFNKKKYSLNEPSSQWVIVNKKNPLAPLDFRPNDLVVPNVAHRVPGHEIMQLRAEPARELERMFAEAEQEGLKLEISSAFRTYSFQSALYNNYVKEQGRQTADRQSARPGYSEHQTGLAVDIQPDNGRCHLEECFGELAEGKWLAANAHRFGFILRYPKNAQQITGYVYEPWHFRYVGKELAAEITAQDKVTLEEFFGLEPAAEY